ncbi:MAG: sigma-54-dependent Fis family transcriptional regulator [Kofleriaceae bacterium]|nr:sigma-54-dependent Fis family transcriptional regulator [Kofleriaceae bacterium]
MAAIIIADDQKSVRFTLGEILGDAGHTILMAETGEDALRLASEADLIVTDFAMPKMDGLELLKQVRAEHRGLPVIMLTARGSERIAVDALKLGASDYLLKPVDLDELTLAVARALEFAHLRRENRKLSASLESGFIGESKAIKSLLRLVERIADKEVPVLIQGETGTGKERIAALVHAHSNRSSGPFVQFNCGAIPPELAASELFGHVRGAFTGADRDRKGYFAQADGGTLVLDEIAELPLSLQPLLLRALQEGEIQRVGTSKIEKVNVRVVSCTHQDLLAAVEAGAFREDLYYRLAVLNLDVPPLRDRCEDIPLLANHFVQRYRRQFGMEEIFLSKAAMAALQAQSWPGNVRELENAIVRMVALAESNELNAEVSERVPSSIDNRSLGPLRTRIAAYEASILKETMRATGGNQSEAARRLGVTRVTLIDKLKRHGLK